jgi:AbrB family looped-hinge helix DNA binding protein
MSELPAVMQVDVRGRVQIPLSIRRALGIKPGDFVSMKISKIPEDMIIAKNESENPHEALALAFA